MRNQWNMPTEWEPVIKDSGDKRQAVNLWNLGDGQIRNIVKSVRQGHYYRYPDKTITKYISNSILHDFDLPWILLPKINSSGVAKDAVYGHYIGHHKIPNNHPFLVHLQKACALYKLTDFYRDSSSTENYETLVKLSRNEGWAESKAKGDGSYMSLSYNSLASFCFGMTKFNIADGMTNALTKEADEFLTAFSNREPKVYHAWMATF
tara:strand:+ start:2521 stop:3141 length:621 start_codon:yes stop_codon:yes gene_type:complete